MNVFPILNENLENPIGNNYEVYFKDSNIKVRKLGPKEEPYVRACGLILYQPLL